MNSTNDIMLSAIIVDDELDACRNLKDIIHEYITPQINLLGIANNTSEAEQLINTHKPDVVFLDIEMPNEDAFHFLDRLHPFSFEVIFVTAYDEYAIRALKLNAVDYILKPISIQELQHAINKLREKLTFKNIIKEHNISFSNISNDIKTKNKQNKIVLKDNNSIDVVDFKDIIFVEAKGSYSKICYLNEKREKNLIVSYPISEYEDILPNDIFFRIHKSYLVNCGYIKNIVKEDAPSILMKNKQVLPVGRRRYSGLMMFLKSSDYHNE